MVSSHMSDFHYHYENSQNCSHRVTEGLLKIQQQTTKRFSYKTYVAAKFNDITLDLGIMGKIRLSEKLGEHSRL